MKNFENISNMPTEDTEGKDESIVTDELEKKENSIEQNPEGQRFMDKEKGFMETLSGKAKTVARVMVLCTALAAVGWSNVEASDTVKKHKYTREELQQNNKGRYSKDERIQRRVEEARKKAIEKRRETRDYIKRASELADKMGIAFDSDNSVVQLEGFAPITINGKDVPMNMLTDEEQQNIERARKITQSLERNIDDENKKETGSKVTKSNDYMDTSNF